ncbi:phosphoribosyltransferase [Pseudopedobacter saltans DSM 12145]|uniref:Phosphoribosyltransferase n=1 Tax=Pseudopedobacter saltans (strain ATCC 51119 / DSM 12145 / JCM 21818 / CCUG 39354 / LMG 10337 / NBRC 100064 / NCIMB 13643) TaxID=762903 RepID=F0S5N1_PSESL|nr:phosphoribosyltransferase family protein [Pseudopedobacter saltans]ADY54205.1 phosphoribosyltransferase [Pseudopedobacter saltans DSM 12145]
MPSKRVLILNHNQIQQKINRIAYQILEDNIDEQEVILAGIVSRGYRLALRLQKVLKKISHFKIRIIEVELNKDSSKLESSIDTPLKECENKVIILVDDVLNSGRTIAYGLGVFLNIPLKRLRSVVLIDRSHKLFPVSADFVGLELSTVLKEHVSVVLDENGEEDGVYLE